MSSSTWKTLTDAATGKLYYYNTATQATQWEMPSELQQSAPTEAPTPPTSPSVPQAGVDVWYELYHHSYGRCYYYNKQTGQTCWERPTTGTVQVFNQTESLQAPSPTSAPRHPVAALFAHSVQQPDSPQAIRPSSASHLPVARPGDSSRGLSGEANRSFGDHPNHPHLAGQLAPGWEEYNDQQSGKKYYVHRASGKTTWNRAEAVSTPANLSSPQLETRQISSVSSPSTSFPSPAVSQSSVRSTVGSLPSLTQTPQKQAVGHLSVNGPIDPATIYSDAGHSLPKMLIVDIHKFQETDFARKHFMERKKGFFRRTVTKYEIMTFSKEVVDKSILRVSRHLEKLAIRCFKKIMKFMGDYRCKNQDREGMMLITFGTDHFELRDEIFCQLAKQITENPSEESNIRGWGLFGLCLSCFQPSPALTDHLKEILDAHAHGKNEKVATFAKFCLARIGRKDMPEKRNFTHTDIHRCPELPWKPNYFNCSIAELLDYQGDNGKPDAVPKFLVALIDGVLKYNGSSHQEQRIQCAMCFDFDFLIPLIFIDLNAPTYP
eukprot:TRINITY_DN7339_c0_g1_i5.p1 TRINITY_DN7339_c0_g1~~TRINITY_DN7339_c0_g1_i5.p1  ORF type:complete len:548 (+),score=82.03 TRINITY_DN7339_c0_g1_i5:209-1852(+)